MSSKKDFSPPTAAPSAGSSRIPAPSVKPSQLGATRGPAPSVLPTQLDATRRPAPSMLQTQLDATRRPAPSMLQTQLDATRRPAPSMLQTQLDETRGPAPSTVNNFISRAPPSTKSVLQTPLDFHMASRQPNFATLTPKEQTKQNDWAQDMIKRVGACPENFEWERRENPGGYQCEGGGHGITDELLAEGKGGIMAHTTKKWGESKGPYYPDPETGKFKRVRSYLL